MFCMMTIHQMLMNLTTCPSLHWAAGFAASNAIIDLNKRFYM